MVTPFIFAYFVTRNFHCPIASRAFLSNSFPDTSISTARSSFFDGNRDMDSGSPYILPDRNKTKAGTASTSKYFDRTFPCPPWYQPRRRSAPRPRPPRRVALQNNTGVLARTDNVLIETLHSFHLHHVTMSLLLLTSRCFLNLSISFRSC